MMGMRNNNNNHSGSFMGGSGSGLSMGGVGQMAIYQN
jgi:hypothetical protein